MRLYSGTVDQFIGDTVQNQIAEKLRLAFLDYYRYSPGNSEVQSWRNSLRALKDVIGCARLGDHGIMLEYQLPLSSRRLDCMLCGKDPARLSRAVVVELKQWERCDHADGENEVLTRLGGTEREVLHPSVQVGRYATYLRDTHTAFYEEPDPIRLSACSYLHNYVAGADDPLLASKFRDAVADAPIFFADHANEMSARLREELQGGGGLEVLSRIEQSRYRPSKKLMTHVAEVIAGKPQFVLLDEQLVAFDRVLVTARKGFHDRRRTVIIIRGGPGTGKSVIAINLMGQLLKAGYNTHYATGSRAFTETLRRVIGPRGTPQFRYFNSYTEAARNDIDVLICDESHRIRKTSNSRFAPKERRSGVSQIEELLRCAKVSVFLIDDHQVVRPDEIGSASYIRDAALNYGCALHDYELDIQFRCGGSEAFINWVNNTLQITKTPNILFRKEEQSEFELRIFSDPVELEGAIRQKEDEGYSARVTAGFCWPWSDPTHEGFLVSDVAVGSYQRPWNAKPEAARLAAGIPKSHFWATDPNGLEQVGCIYTAQGFEFDYVGVIFGNDLVYDPDEATWKGSPGNSYDTVVKRSASNFTDLVKHTYRVLLTRGLKGCYVYFMDKNTERFFRSRLE